MLTKKTVLVVGSLAIVSGLLTVGMMGRHNMMYGTYGSTSFSRGMGGGVFMEEPMMATEDMASSKMMAEPAIGIAPPYYGDDAIDVAERIIEYSAYHSVVVRDVTGYLARIEQSALDKGGRVLSSSQDVYQGKTTGSLMLKVPQEQFSQMNTEIGQDIKKVISKSINTWDSTGEGVRYDEQLQDLRDQLAVLQTQLEEAETAAQRTSIQNQINRINQQITNVERNQENFGERVIYSTINVTASDSERALTGGPGTIMEQWRAAWESLGGVGRAAAMAAIWIVVYAVIWLPLVLLGKVVVSRLKK